MKTKDERNSWHRKYSPKHLILLSATMKEYLHPNCSPKRTSLHHDFALPRALLLAKIETRLRTARENRTFNATIIRDLVKHRDRYKRTDGAWLGEAIDLVVQAKLDPVGYKSSLNHLDSFAKVFPYYNIQLFQRMDPMKKYDLKWASGFDADKKKLNIPLFNDSFDSFHPTRSTVGYTICKYCYKEYSKRRYHHCHQMCYSCWKFNCNGKPLDDLFRL